MSSTDKKECKTCSTDNLEEKKMSRRDFLGLSAFWSCIVAWFFAGVGLLKFPLPALLPDISSVFKLGKVDDIPLGGQKIFEEQKVLVMRDEKGIRAISLICTHLGCIVGVKDKGGFSCPCHGSKFDEKGHVTGGPAPKALPWLEVSQLPNGKLVVNTDKFVSEETTFTV